MLPCLRTRVLSLAASQSEEEKQTVAFGTADWTDIDPMDIPREHQQVLSTINRTRHWSNPHMQRAGIRAPLRRPVGQVKKGG